MGTTKNPFAPGTATEPPHLAGREEQRKLITEALQLIAEPLVDGSLEHSPLAPIKIIGPRGAGKTTLLHLAGAAARRQGIHVIVNARLRSLAPGSAIDRKLRDGMDWREWIPLELSRLFRLGWGFGPANASAEREQQEQETFDIVLQTRLCRQPVLLLLDEAMHYDIASLGDLLQACQQMIGAKLPLAVMMAGTPALDGKLKQTKATFIQRCEEMYIHQLSDEAVRDALRKPLLDNGVAAVADEALDLMASWTDNYPYFVQLAGKAVWKAMRADGRNEIDLALAQSAEAAMQKRRQDYYREVFEVISQAEALDYASQIVAIVEATDSPLPPEKVRAELAAANDGMSNEEARKIFNLLLDNSLIWLADKRRVHPAFPSFFSYFKKEYALNAKVE